MCHSIALGLTKSVPMGIDRWHGVREGVKKAAPYCRRRIARPRLCISHQESSPSELNARVDGRCASNYSSIKASRNAVCNDSLAESLPSSISHGGGLRPLDCKNSGLYLTVAPRAHGRDSQHGEWRCSATCNSNLQLAGVSRGQIAEHRDHCVPRTKLRWGHDQSG